MANFKNMIKSKYGIGAIIALTMGAGLTTGGTVMFTMTQETREKYEGLQEASGGTIGTGVNNWMQLYDENGNPEKDYSMSLYRNNFISSHGGYNKVDALTKAIKNGDQYLPKTLLENMLQNDVMNNWGIALVSIGPVSMVASVPLFWFAKHFSL
ncbi:MAG: hypothetical protein ACRC42_03165 [Mycoplasma sp.]